MKHSSKFRITITDEAHLRTVADASFSPAALIIIGATCIMASLLLAGFIVMVTPLRTLLPGYLKEAQRSATEDNLMRLDSLSSAYEKNQAFIDNYLRVTDIERKPVDSIAVNAAALALAPDSLLPPSKRERQFNAAMEERERFNISVLAPLEADGMMFAPVSDQGVFTSASRASEKGEVLMPQGAPVCAIADGTVLAAYYSPAAHGYVTILLHARGFASSYSRLGSLMVSPGDIVNAGQAISLPPAPTATGKRTVEIMMWHNGMPVIPFSYVGGTTHEPDDPPFEAPRGR